jgi:endonuclease/exonuclease/phosphatase family metal-dependent hydrolase
VGAAAVLFASYNIQFGRGRDGRIDLERIASELAGADVIALQEAERHWRRSGSVDQPATLARLLRCAHWVYGPGVDLHLASPPPGVPPGARRQFGNLILARAPLRWSRNHLLPKHASTGPLSLQRSALEAVVDTRAGPLRVYSVHLTHLSPQTRLPQVERLLAIHRDACLEGAPIACGDIKAEWVDEGLPVAMPREAVIMGDFNMEPESEEYARMVGPAARDGTRLSNPEGFVDAWTVAGHRERDGVTSDVLGRPARLDYCFVSTPLAGRVRAARIDSEARGSDHQPVWVDLDL